MTKSSFYFHLLQTTVAHLLKAHGFARSSARAIQVLTDIAIRFITLLMQTLNKYAQGHEPTIQDITRAFLDLHIITPNQRLDPEDTSEVTAIGVANFEKWFNDEINHQMRVAARPDANSLERRRENRRKMNGVNYRMHDLAKMLEQQNKQAQMQNPTMPLAATNTLGSAGQNKGRADDADGADVLDGDDLALSNSLVDNDWLQFILRDQITDHIMTQKLKIKSNDLLSESKPSVFKDTVLSEYIPQDLQKYVQGDRKPNTDFIIKGPLPENLMHAFPYYKSDMEDSSDESEEDSSDESESENAKQNNNNGDDDGDENMDNGDNGAPGDVAAREDDVVPVEAGHMGQFDGFDYFEHDLGFEGGVADQQGGDVEMNLFGQ